MPGEPVRLGPYIGGLNTLSDPTALADTELVDCVNFELDLDGSLLSRPPITLHDSSLTAKVRHLGFFSFAGTDYHIASADSITYRSVDGATWVAITATFAAGDMVQYDNKAWLVNAAGAGGYWTPGGGFVSVATMPAGTAMGMLKERMFIVGGSSRLSWSNITNPAVWTAASDFADVNPGDGQNLIDLAVFNDNLILFKNDSTYSYPFDTGPSTGLIRRVSSTIGATKRDCVILYEQNLYVYHEGNVYEVVNYDFSRINSKVPFAYDPTAPSAFSDEVFLTTFGDRLIVRYYNRIYVFGLRTRTWTRWTSSLYFGPLKAAPINTTVASNNPYYGGACVVGNTSVYRIDDGFDAVRSEAMTCSLQTKNYDLSISHKFKRLFWWGIDISSFTAVVGRVTPVVYTFATTWQNISTLAWNQVFTWARPSSMTPFVESTVTAVVGGGSRKFIKFLKSIRFRQVYFNVSTTTTGKTSDAPVRFFTITAMVTQKQDVSASVS